MELKLETKFIEGTNNQYSIRNDGVVISHYKIRLGKIFKWHKEIKGNTQGIVTFFHRSPMKWSTTIKELTKTYFGFYYCKCCGDKVYDKPATSYHCNSCVKKNLKQSVITYKSNNKTALKERTKRLNDKNALNLTDTYIVKLLKTNLTDCDPIYIEAQRTKIKLIRQIKQLQNGKKESLS
jgi:hypothetical protein